MENSDHDVFIKGHFLLMYCIIEQGCLSDVQWAKFNS